MADPRRSRSSDSPAPGNVPWPALGAFEPINLPFQPVEDPRYRRAWRAPPAPPADAFEPPRASSLTPEMQRAAQMPPPGPFSPVNAEFHLSPTPRPRSASRGRAPSRAQASSSSPSPVSPYANMTDDARFIAALGYLDGIGGVGALLHRVVNHRLQPVFQAHSFEFWRTKKLTTILDACWKDPFGHDQLLQWMRPKADDLVLAEVSKQMERVKRSCLKHAKDYTVDELMSFRLEKDIFPVMERDGPLVLRFIQAAVETERGLVEHKKKTSFVVRIL
jgi:hypothetical protein